MAKKKPTMGKDKLNPTRPTVKEEVARKDARKKGHVNADRQTESRPSRLERAEELRHLSGDGN